MSYTIATKQDGWIVFTTIPFFRADLYAITLISQNLIGTNVIGTFSNRRFVINKTNHGINILSSDTDIISWFSPGHVYEFKYNASRE